jgi:uncharacterized protein
MIMTIVQASLGGEAGIQQNRRRFLFLWVAAVLGSFLLIPRPVRAEETPEPRVLTDARLFHAAPRISQRVWSDAVRGGVEKVFFKSSDGVILRGWFYPSSDPNAPYVITFHGNNEIIADTYTQARNGLFFAQLNLNVVTFDYRGTGFSDGAISLKRARADALAVYDFVAKKAAGRPVFVCGWSLGSIFASHVAGSRDSLAGLILLAPISTAAAVAPVFGGPAHARVVVPTEVAEGIQNATELRNYRQPLLVVHGTADSVVPIAQGRDDYDAAGSTDKTFVPVPGKDHVTGIWSIEADNAIAAFLARHVPAAKAAGQHN